MSKKRCHICDITPHAGKRNTRITKITFGNHKNRTTKHICERCRIIKMLNYFEFRKKKALIRLDKNNKNYQQIQKQLEQ